MSVLGRVLEQGWQQLLLFLQVDAAARPRLFAVIVVLILGFVGGRIASELVRTLLKMTSLDEFGVRSDIQSLLRDLSYRGSLSDLVADLVKWGIYVLAVLSLMYVFGFRVAADYSAKLVGWATSLLLAGAVLLLGVVVADRLEEVTVRLFRVSRITGLVDDSGAETPVYVIAGRAVKYLGVVIAFILALAVAGVDLLFLGVITAVVGTAVVLALAFGTRDLVRNIAVSIYFQLARVFTADDRITVGEYEGKISGVRPMYTTLESGDTTYYIPNWKLVTEVVEREEE
ncbi:MAG: mechanosensitive ion channel [Candidatus Nanohaloarchaea archaeon]|nr:mechanosensitive ion channel [Candidatus Nanohaloarchaea archaeon]